ncbi:MAG: TonB-dependent receptor [Campylobacterales bacterium]
MKKSVILSLAACSAMMAADQLETVTVEDVAERLSRSGAVKDVIVKTEVISEKEIEQKQAATLSEAIENEPGIQAATGCSMCGMKRIRINGLKGEHTTVLVDDVPMNSTVSSYYGMDAMTTAGVASIEIARGSGASLIAPGAIGGVINVKSKKAERNGLFFDAAAGNEEYRLLSIVGTGVSEDGKTRATVSAQYNKQGQWDEDNNGVNESPLLENQSVSVRFSRDLGDYDNLDIKLTRQRSDVFGGPVTDDHYAAEQDAGDPHFVGDDVRNRYDGAALGTLEAITTEREEAIARWTHEIDEESNVIVTGSGARQTQDSLYEGDDYANEDIIYYGDIRYNNMITDTHFLTVGADTKDERMDASSRALFEDGNISQDDFNMASYGLYVQDIWSPTENLEVSFALRADKITVDWTDQKEEGNEIDETLLVPRLHVRWNHSDAWTSRFSAGQGYRAPLTFFESEHGILDEGFGVDIDKVERSNSVGYALSYDDARWTATASATWTQIENLAYINTDDYDRPTLATLDKQLNTYAYDIVAGYQLTPELSLGGSVEHYEFDRAYKEAQFLAQVEDRVRLLVDYEDRGWTANLTATWIGSRDLSEYGYEGWNRLADVGNPDLAKETDAPAYYTVDVKISKDLDDQFTLYAGVKNLFDYTQTGDGMTPLFYDAEGGYDVGYIYGPLRGRQIYAGLRAQF